MARSVRARSGWRKMSPGCGARPLGRKVRLRVGHGSRYFTLLTMALTRISSIGKPSASSMAGCTTSAKDLVPYSRSVTSAASTMPGTSAGRMPATGTQFFRPPASGGEVISSSAELVVAEELGGGELGHGADAGDGVHLAVLGAHQDGGFAAESEVRKLRRRTAASMVATPASTALPPW